VKLPPMPKSIKSHESKKRGKSSDLLRSLFTRLSEYICPFFLVGVLRRSFDCTK
jgi:hypothetical protein